MTSSSLWLEAHLVSADLKLKMEIQLTPKLLLESSVFLAAKESQQTQINIICSDTLTMRAFLKIVEYCWNTAEDPTTTCEDPLEKMSELGIFGRYYAAECLNMARYLDLTFLTSCLKQIQNLF